MMGNGRYARAALLVGAVLLCVTGSATRLAAQNGDDRGALLEELQQVQAELATIELRAVEQTPALQAQRQQLKERVLAAMVEVDSRTNAHMERLSALPEEVHAAEQRQDEAAVRSLLQEAQRLHDELNRIQATALTRKDVTQAVAAFQDQLLRRMIEIEPKTEALVARSKELMQRLRAQS